MNVDKIDFVVTWVDSDDPEWMAEYSKYRTTKHSEDSARFRNWDIFRYWFRAVETYAPWVNKIYLVTSGQYPKWINRNHPKLVLIKHSDYIPAQYLPTFNSRCIELNFGRIKGLSDHFVYFNDDMFLNAPVSKDYYFKDGLPCDSPAENVTNSNKYDKRDSFGISISVYCNVSLLNSHFNRKKVVKAAPHKWFGRHLSLKHNLLSLLLYKRECFQGFNIRHTEQPFLRQTFIDIWNHEPDFMDKSCTRFRENVSLTPYFARYWQLASNNFYPTRLNPCAVCSINEDTVDSILKALCNPKIKSICINDCPFCSPEFYKTSSEQLLNAFEAKFPTKSSFEL